MVSRAAEEFGPYLVYEQLGIGGMATVHRAETTGLEGFRRPVALKRMLPHCAANDDLVKSFVREARLASHLRHANVAQTYDLGKVGDIYFIAMELIVGWTLRDILRLCAKKGVQIPMPIALNILNQVCDALDYAHNLTDDSGAPLGIIHRDVSPSNIIVADGGVVKLIDFGIAKASAAGMQTMSGTIKGKFSYMAPEYLGGKIDARADLFALGIIAHEMLTGQPLFQGRDDMDTLYRVKSMKIAPPSRSNLEVPEEIDSIVMTALLRDPNLRWQHATAMRVALTTELKRLGMTLLDHQIGEWVQRLFEDAAVTGDTPVPTRVLGTPSKVASGSSSYDESIVIERAASEPSEEDDVRDAAKTLLLDHSRPSARAAREAEVPSAGRTLLGNLPVAPSLNRAPRVTSRPLDVAVAAPKGAEPARPTAPVSTHWSNLTIALLLLVAAVASGAVVYFGLPYVQ